MSIEPTTCAADGCGETVRNGRCCDDHECATGGCSMPNATGDGEKHCRTHECAEDGCGDQAYGNELFCISHRE